MGIFAPKHELYTQSLCFYLDFSVNLGILNSKLTQYTQIIKNFLDLACNFLNLMTLRLIVTSSMLATGYRKRETIVRTQVAFGNLPRFSPSLPALKEGHASRNPLLMLVTGIEPVRVSPPTGF